MIEVSHLTKFFGPVQAVNDVSFQVEQGEIVGLLGNNGAGKTTIMRMLTTYLPATSGIAKVDGYDVMMQSLEVRKRIGYLPESIPLYGEMRVEEYLQYRAKLKGVDRHVRNQRVLSSLDRCRVREVGRRLLGTLSKGFRQRVGLADALLSDPKLLILDEPTDGLDPGQKAETLKMLRDLAHSHTIMLSSHLLSEVESLVNRVIIMRRGHLALARKLTDLEADDVVVAEIKGAAAQVTSLLKGLDGAGSIAPQDLGDGWNLFEIRVKNGHDIRETLFQRVVKNNLTLRRLDLRRRTLQDRWNEINSAEEVSRPPSAMDTAREVFASTPSPQITEKP